MAFLGRPSEQDDLRAAAYGDWLQRRNPCAIASFVLGLFSLVELGVLIVFGVAGIALGVVALKQLRQINAQTNAPDAAKDDEPSDSPPKTHGRRLAWAGIVLSVLSLIAAAVVYSLPRT